MSNNEKYNKGMLKKTLAAGVIAGVLAINTSPAVAAVANIEAEKNNTYTPASPAQIESYIYAADFPLDVVEFVDIPDESVPLDDGIDQEGSFITIDAVDVPLSNLPQTGVNGWASDLPLLGLSLSGMLLTIRGIKDAKKK